MWKLHRNLPSECSIKNTAKDGEQTRYLQVAALWLAESDFFKPSRCSQRSKRRHIQGIVSTRHTPHTILLTAQRQANAATAKGILAKWCLFIFLLGHLSSPCLQSCPLQSFFPQRSQSDFFNSIELPIILRIKSLHSLYFVLHSLYFGLQGPT